MRAEGSSSVGASSRLTLDSGSTGERVAFFCVYVASQVFCPKAQSAHPGSPEGVFRKIGRQAERGAVPAGGTYHPALGRPDRRPGHYEPDVRDDSLNGFRSRHRMFPMSANLKWAKSGKPDFASGSAQVRFGIRKNAAVERRKACALRYWARDAASWRPNVPRHGTLRCGDPHQRLSALRPL